MAKEIVMKKFGLLILVVICFVFPPALFVVVPVLFIERLIALKDPVERAKADAEVANSEPFSSRWSSIWNIFRKEHN